MVFCVFLFVCLCVCGFDFFKFIYLFIYFTKGSSFSLAAMHPYILLILPGIHESSLNDSKCYCLYLASSQLRLPVALCSRRGWCGTWVLLEGQRSPIVFDGKEHFAPHHINKIFALNKCLFTVATHDATHVTVNLGYQIWCRTTYCNFTANDK